MKFMEAINLFKQFKLGNSLFKGSWILPEKMTAGAYVEPQNLLERAQSEMAIQLARKIMHENKSVITYENIDGEHRYRAEILILKKEDLKLIVEGAIAQLSDRQIQQIREGK